MSAILAMLRLDGQPVASADLERMARTMAHRGPDGRAVEALGLAGLGHLLMRVTHEDAHEAQPLHEGGVALVADARIDNREALAATLRIDAARLAAMPDSALVLAAWRRWGDDCVDHLIGDFAAAIWDGEARRLVLLRDHMGQRALFYTVQRDFIAVASEVRALLALPGVPRALSRTMIGLRLMRSTAYGPGSSFHQGIQGLPGGTLAVAGADGALTLRRYWRPRADPVHEGRDEAYYVATYRALLAEAVACRIRRARKAAALQLSGGFDSSAIAGLAGDVLRPEGRKLIAVSALLAPGQDAVRGNARSAVEACARHMPHVELHPFVRARENVLDRLDEYFLLSELPASETHYIRTALHRSAAAAGAQVVMDGHGGDYTVNPRGHGALAWVIRHGRWREILPTGRTMARRRRTSLAHELTFALRQMIPLPVRALARRITGSGGTLWQDRMIAPRFASQLLADGVVRADQLRDRPRNASDMRAMMVEALNRQCDSASAAVPASPAAHGLELTMPFHDKRIVEFGLAVPEALHAKGGMDRYLARRALGDILPPELLAKPARRNDVLDPDMAAMTAGIREPLLALADSLAQDARVARDIDVGRVRATLARCSADPRSRDGVMALRALLLGRYIQWSEQQNAAGSGSRDGFEPPNAPR
jgi:asparagine synthase (glutamine-hydrolysing)